jgi:hypothetical protein
MLASLAPPSGCIIKLACGNLTKYFEGLAWAVPEAFLNCCNS